MHVKFEVRIALTVLQELLLTGPLRRHTHRHTTNENSISAIHFVHLAEIKIRLITENHSSRIRFYVFFKIQQT